ncbi:Nitrogen regulation protein NtrX [Rubellimicrobium mesophilum DSM 19309]|uniref:Nitrogen regulation protein NtrX n=1 Tax=Rubellimicrobium mesophilum DSM 19309 TaxID=442562 RepID=A0A017HGV4_9RHOB|nr:Nitrogen regulation protein NtrX [Rubellimicrobium mesophilum DSM 19309]
MGDILITDDERDIRELISDILKDEGYTTRLAGSSDQCMAEIAREVPSLMILDIWLKDSRMDGIDILKQVKREHPEIPIIIISGHGNIEIAVAAIKQGAYDFIEKPFNIEQLLVVIRRAMEASRLRRENIALKRGDSQKAEMLGDSASFRALRAQLDKVTKSNGRVMLTGEPRVRQGIGGALHPRELEPRGRALRGGVLRLDRARALRGGAVRAGVRRQGDREGPAGAGPWRRHLLRRGGGHAARHPVQDPEGARGPAVRARGGQRKGPCRPAGHLVLESRPDRRHRGRHLPTGAVPPAERGADPRAVAGGAARGHPAPGRAFHPGAEPDAGPAAAASGRGCAGASPDDALAGERAAAPQRDRARADPGGFRRGHHGQGAAEPRRGRER